MFLKPLHTTPAQTAGRIKIGAEDLAHQRRWRALQVHFVVPLLKQLY